TGNGAGGVAGLSGAVAGNGAEGGADHRAAAQAAAHRAGRGVQRARPGFDGAVDGGARRATLRGSRAPDVEPRSWLPGPALSARPAPCPRRGCQAARRGSVAALDLLTRSRGLLIGPAWR